MSKNILIRLFYLGLCLLSINAFALNDSGVKVKWGYEGRTNPNKWGQLSPAFRLCAKGKSQSPINISNPLSDDKNSLAIHYQSDPLNIVDNGDTELLIGKTQTLINEGHGVQVNFPAQYEKELITYNGADYQLIQFHMHTPSENKLNGKSFPLEIHFVHQGENGSIAVIGVFVKIGEENAELKKIIANIPKHQGVAVSVKGEKINPAKLMPASKKYYTFAGSLTTPPCSEGLQWIVMKDAITATPEQIAAIKAAAHGANARPIQPLNKRKVYYTEN